MVHMQRSEDTLQELVFSFHLVGPSIRHRWPDLAARPLPTEPHQLNFIQRGDF